MNTIGKLLIMAWIGGVGYSLAYPWTVRNVPSGTYQYAGVDFTRTAREFTQHPIWDTDHVQGIDWRRSFAQAGVISIVTLGLAALVGRGPVKKV